MRSFDGENHLFVALLSISCSILGGEIGPTASNLTTYFCHENTKHDLGLGGGKQLDCSSYKGLVAITTDNESLLSTAFLVVGVIITIIIIIIIIKSKST